MNKIKLKVDKSNTVKTVTILISILLLFACITIAQSLLNNGFHWAGVIGLVLIITTLIGTFFYAPVSIEIDEQTLAIKKVFGATRINRSNIVDVYPYYKGTFTIRLFGAGGVFGYIGLYRNNEEGKYISYVGDYDQAYYIVLKNKKKYLVSSQQPETAISILKGIS